MRNPCVNHRGNAGLHYPSNINSRRHALIIKRRNCPFRIFRQRDLTHRVGDLGCIRWRTGTHESCNRWRRCHRETAKPYRLDNRGISHIGIGIGRTEPREIQTIGHFHRCCKPFVPKPTDSNTEIRTVAAHGCNDAGTFNITHRVGDRLSHRHGNIQKKLIVRGDE